MPAWWGAGAADLWSEAADGYVADPTKRNAPSSPPLEDSRVEAAVAHEQISPAAGSDSRANPASDIREPNALLPLLQGMWELEKDKVAPLRKDFPAAKTWDTSERRSKRTRAR